MQQVALGSVVSDACTIGGDLFMTVKFSVFQVFVSSAWVLLADLFCVVDIVLFV